MMMKAQRGNIHRNRREYSTSKRPGRRTILLSVEGETEKKYFRAFNSNQKQYHITFARGNDTDAAGLVRSSSSDGYECIISNPCFKVWYLCHFCFSTKQYATCDAVVRELQNYMPDYSKGADVYTQVEPRTKDAIANAKHLEETYRKLGKVRGDVDANPVTEVYRGIELIKGNWSSSLESIKDE